MSKKRITVCRCLFLHCGLNLFLGSEIDRFQNFENQSFADNTLIMFVKSFGQFAIETYRSGQSLEKYP